MCIPDSIIQKRIQIANCMAFSFDQVPVFLSNWLQEN